MKNIFTTTITSHVFMAILQVNQPVPLQFSSSTCFRTEPLMIQSEMVHCYIDVCHGVLASDSRHKGSSVPSQKFWTSWEFPFVRIFLPFTALLSCYIALCWFMINYLFLMSNKIPSDTWHRCVMCRMPFLSPNQQCQSTAGNLKHWSQPVNITYWPHPFFIHHHTPGTLLHLCRLSNTSTPWHTFPRLKIFEAHKQLITGFYVSCKMTGTLQWPLHFDLS